MLTELSIHDFFTKMAGKEAPGGGSGAAMTGLNGVCLLEMAVKVSKVSLTETEFSGALDELTRLHQELENLINADAEVLARALPALTRVGPDGSQEEWNEILLEAVHIPFEIAQACIDALVVAKQMKDKLHQNVVCDATFGAMSCNTALQGAVLLAELNISLLRGDAELMEKLKIDMMNFAEKSDMLIDAILRK
ncbi:cyclodeaminase/cyclohydrolase family protein [Anaerosinus sp.]|uniref:cyclodeaminase/cyclohydrolase family protein n=1 Tax=Selenobaculum sp. TaxID=3074374 RepID=UPI0015AD3CE3